MTARTTMSDLITRARSLIGDTSGTATQHYTDENIQTTMDAHRELVIREMLEVYPIPTGTGYEYKNYAGRGAFEKDATIIDATWGTITAGTADEFDYLNGRYTFASDQGPTKSSLFITGKRYDIYGAVADLCDDWAASIKTNVDFQAGSSRFTQSQVITNLKNMARQFRGKSEGGGVGVIHLTRSDTDFVHTRKDYD